MILDDYLTLFGVAVFAAMGLWRRQRAKKVMRHEGRFRSTLTWASAGASFCAARWLSCQLVDRVEQDIHEEAGVLLRRQRQAMMVRVPHGTFFTRLVSEPIVVSYRVGRFSGRVYAIEVREKH